MKKPHIRMFQNGSCYGHWSWIVFGPTATGLGDTLKMAWHSYERRRVDKAVSTAWALACKESIPRG
jgi:hypothetical protein